MFSAVDLHLFFANPDLAVLSMRIKIQQLLPVICGSGSRLTKFEEKKLRYLES